MWTAIFNQTIMQQETVPRLWKLNFLLHLRLHTLTDPLRLPLLSPSPCPLDYLWESVTDGCRSNILAEDPVNKDHWRCCSNLSPSSSVGLAWGYLNTSDPCCIRLGSWTNNACFFLDDPHSLPPLSSSSSRQNIFPPHVLSLAFSSDYLKLHSQLRIMLSDKKDKNKELYAVT